LQGLVKAFGNDGLAIYLLCGSLKVAINQKAAYFCDTLAFCSIYY
jgi:hypothetical protein